jgi:hypothetical protein
MQIDARTVMITETLHIDHHMPWEDKAYGEQNSPYTNMLDEHCHNVVETLYEVDFDIDPRTGRVSAVRLNNGQEFKTVNQSDLDLALKAHDLANREVIQEWSVIVLYPSRDWDDVCHKTQNLCICGYVWQRTSDQHSNLRSFASGRLILVAADDAGWDEQGLKIAKDKLRAVKKAKLIKLFRDGTVEHLEGQDIWA